MVMLGPAIGPPNDMLTPFPDIVVTLDNELGR